MAPGWPAWRRPDAREMAPGRTLTARRADGSEFPIEASVAGFAAGGRASSPASCATSRSRVAAERALAESEARLRTIVDTVPVGLVMARAALRPHPRRHAHRRRWCAIPCCIRPSSTCYGAHGSTFPRRWHRVAARRRSTPLARMVQAGEETPSLEVHYQRGDGTRGLDATSWAGRCATPTAGGRRHRRHGRRGSRERRAGAALAASEAEFRATFEQAAVGIAHVALDGGWLRVNDRLLRHHRLCAGGVAGPHLPADHPSGRPGRRPGAGRRRCWPARIDTFAMEKRYIRADGTVVWVNLTVSVARDAAGRPDRFISVIEDIAARSAAEAALAGSEQRYRTPVRADGGGLRAVGGDARRRRHGRRFPPAGAQRRDRPGDRAAAAGLHRPQPADAVPRHGAAPLRRLCAGGRDRRAAGAGGAGGRASAAG